LQINIGCNIYCSTKSAHEISTDERAEATPLRNSLGFFQMKFFESFLPTVGIFAYFLKGKGGKKAAHHESLNFQMSHLAFSKACVKILLIYKQYPV